MYKRALMLTAATAALLAGPAYAADPTITTDASGPVNITNNYSIASSSTPATVPAIEINSATASKNIVTIATNASLTFSGTPAAVGIQGDPGRTGEIILDGSLDLSGAGTTKTGILIGSTNGTVGTFTGTVDAANNTITSDPTAVVLESGSLIKVQGDGSYGIHLESGMTMVGDLIVGGTVETLPTTANSTSSAGATGIEMDGTTNGSLIVNTGGVVEGFGQNARGMVVLGQVNGSLRNLGSILSSGTQTAPSSDKGNPAAGTALAVSNNVTGGIYNAGPLSPSDATAVASISTNGNLPALFITPGFLDSTTAAPITIGGYTESAGVTYSLFNRGTISATPQNINGSSTAVEIIGSSQTNTVTLSSGIFNTGTISASTTSDTNASTTNPPVATGMIIGNWANIDAGSNGYAITNSNNGAASGSTTGVGSISASYSGLMPGVATGVAISANANVPSFLNQGKITATALTTDPKITSLT
ncbi:MAG: beta strand repeat-containing protein, partial [Rhizomicrobium sp.]